MRAAKIALLALATLSCADLAGLDDFTKRSVSESASTASDYFTMELSLVAWRPHLGHFVEYRIVDATNYVQSRGVIRSMTAEDVKIRAPRAVPRSNGPYRLDLFADVNRSGGFDGLGSVITNDHAWRLDPIADFSKLRADDVIKVEFVHSTTFTNVDQFPSGTKNPSQDTGLPARVRLEGIDAFAGKTLQVRVADERTGHVVGLFREMRAEGSVLEAVVAGCVDVQTTYQIDVYADANGNGAYDDPSAGGDRGWRLSATSTDTGLAATLNMGEGGDVDVGAP